MNKPIRALYPGSFDPITLGHIDIIRRMGPLFGEVVVLVANSKDKSYLFSAEERLHLVEEALVDVPNLKFDMFDGLTVEYARRVGAQVIVRGLRALSDFENEIAISNMNKSLAPDIETLIAFTSPQHSHVASRLVKEVAAFGGEVGSMVPNGVAKALQRKFQRGK